MAAIFALSALLMGLLVALAVGAGFQAYASPAAFADYFNPYGGIFFALGAAVAIGG